MPGTNPAPFSNEGAAIPVGPIGRWVQSIHDDRPVPLSGLVVGVEDDERLWVLWGETAFAYTEIPVDAPMPKDARIEARDELMPLRRR